MTNKITFGTDPEFPLVEKGTHNLVPPEYLIEFEGLGVHEIEVNALGVRHPIIEKNDEFSIIGDGALFEFTIKPDTDIQTMYSRFLKAKERLAEIGDKYGLEVLHLPIADFNVNKYFNNMNADRVKESVIAGCDPDFDAIDSGYESKTRDLTFWDKRGAGGHIHLGVPDYPELHEHIIPAIRLMAITAGNTYISNVENVEAEVARQEVFGKPGRYRPQNYPNGEKGIEYRTPSNSWLINSDIVSAMGEASYRAIELLKNPKKGIQVIEEYLEGTIESIINVNREQAATILTEVM